MRFGHPVDEISATANDFLAFNSSIFTEQVWLLADALHAGIDEVTATVDAVAAKRDHEIFDHVLRAGTTGGGQRWNWVGRREGRPLVEIETLWTVGNEYPRALAKAATRVDAHHRGRTLDAGALPVPGELRTGRSMIEHVNSANVATAMQVLNAIPAVCAAAPGFATIATLPQVHSLIGFGNF